MALQSSANSTECPQHWQYLQWRKQVLSEPQSVHFGVGLYLLAEGQDRCPGRLEKKLTIKRNETALKWRKEIKKSKTSSESLLGPSYMSACLPLSSPTVGHLSASRSLASCLPQEVLINQGSFVYSHLPGPNPLPLCAMATLIARVQNSLPLSFLVTVNQFSRNPNVFWGNDNIEILFYVVLLY